VKQLIFVLILVITAFFAGCEDHVKIKLVGDGTRTCLVDAFVYKSAYDVQYQLKPFTWSKILLIKWKHEENGVNAHAATVFIINTTEDKQKKNDRLFIFDRDSGSREIPLKLKDDPYKIAIYCYGSDRVEYARFLE